MVSRNAGRWDLGTDFSGGPEGPDRSLLAYVLDGLRYDADGWAVEFGTGSGVSTRMIAEVLPVITFDSFQGLPEDWRPGFSQGHFAEYDMPTDIPGCTVVPGWFKDTVPGYDWPERIALVHFDADLYSSTKTCLESIGPRLQFGAIVVFDEFFGYIDDLTSPPNETEGPMPGEQRAWREYAEESGIAWEVIGHGREQWAIQIGRDSR